MAEIATIARPYAQALFDASRDRLDETSRWLSDLAAVSGNADVQQLARDPKVSNVQLFGLIADSMAARMPDEGNNFLRAVLQAGRLLAVPEMARQFEALKNSVSGASDAVIYSAFPLEGQALDSLVAKLEQRFGRRLKPRVIVDTGLIGGVRVVVGDEVLDASIKSRVEQMKQALTA